MEYRKGVLLCARGIVAHLEGKDQSRDSLFLASEKLGNDVARFNRNKLNGDAATATTASWEALEWPGAEIKLLSYKAGGQAMDSVKKYKHGEERMKLSYDLLANGKVYSGEHESMQYHQFGENKKTVHLKLHQLSDASGKSFGKLGKPKGAESFQKKYGRADRVVELLGTTVLVYAQQRVMVRFRDGTVDGLTRYLTF